MANTKFKVRLASAVKELVQRHKLLKVKNQSLYTPMRIKESWKWMAFSEPDGLLARTIIVAQGDPAKPDSTIPVIAGVLIESEESTSNSLLNPWGKSNIPTIPNGVWIDYKDGSKRKRSILAVAHVILVTPEPKTANAKTKARFEKRKSILTRVDAASSNSSLLIVGKNDSKLVLANEIWRIAEPFLE